MTNRSIADHAPDGDRRVTQADAGNACFDQVQLPRLASFERDHLDGDNNAATVADAA
jgi:hypothetical protein